MREKIDIKHLSKVLLCCRKTGKHIVAKGYNHILNLTYNNALPNFEMQSQAFKSWCEKYPTIEEADRHIEELERNVRKEFFDDFISNNNKHNMRFVIEKVKTKEELKVNSMEL